MEEFTIIQLKIPADFDYKLNRLMVELKKLNVRTTKASLIIKLAQIGLLHDKL